MRPQKRRLEELLAELDRLRQSPNENPQVISLIHDLQMHQEEIRSQQSALTKAQRQLEEIRDRYVDLYDFAPIGYLTLDAVGGITEINLTGAALFGVDRTRLLGAPFVSFVPSGHRQPFLEFMRRCRQPGDATQLTADVHISGAKPAGERIVQLLCHLRPADPGSPPRFLTAMIDRTEQYRLDHERRAADEAQRRLEREHALARASSEAKDRFLARLSHELRTPLTPVLAALSDPALLSPERDEAERTLAMLRRNVEIEVRLIDDLLDLTRISRGRLVLNRTTSDVHATAREAAEMLAPEASGRGIDIAVELPEEPGWVHGDVTRLRQVFWNLLSNAIKFTGPGGRITVTGRSKQGRVIVSVSDTGVGIETHRLHELFGGLDAGIQPPRHGEGLGLGLTICETVVRAHGGSIQAHSDGPGRGSTFEVVLPGAIGTRPAEPAAAAPGPVRQVARPALRVLLVEDHEDSAHLLALQLKRAGHTVTVAPTVHKAVAIAAANDCDVLISDIRLPDGSGLDLPKELPPGMAAIAMSGFGTAEDAHRSREAGFQAHLVKPFEFRTLLDTIDRVTGAGTEGIPEK